MDSRSIRIARTESTPKSAPAKEGSLLAEPGRVLAAEVVSEEAPGRYKLAVGRERVLIESEKWLQIGDRLAVKVESANGELALRAVASKPQGQSALVELLRTHEGVDHKFGPAIQELVSGLRSSVPQDSAKLELLTTLQNRIVGGAVNGSGLAELMRTGGGELEARLLEVATSVDPARSKPLVLRDVASLFLRQLLPAPENPIEVQARFGGLFEGVLQAQPPPRAAELSSASLRRFFTAYARELLTAVSNLKAKDATEIRQRVKLEVGLQRTLAKEILPGSLEPLLQRLFGQAAPMRQQLLQSLREDLKGRLLAVLAGEPKAAEQEQITRVLDAVEQEQARNTARSENGDGRQWSLAMQDGVDLATLKIFRREGGSAEGAEGERALRFSIGVEFSKLGPVRADLSLERNALAVRLTVATEITAELIRGDLDRLQVLLGSGGKGVSLTVTRGTPEQASVDSLERDIRFLSETPLLDLTA